MAVLIVVGLFIFLSVHFYKKTHTNKEKNVRRRASNSEDGYTAPYEDQAYAVPYIDAPHIESENGNTVNAEIAEYEEYDGIYATYGNWNEKIAQILLKINNEKYLLICYSCFHL